MLFFITIFLNLNNRITFKAISHLKLMRISNSKKEKIEEQILAHLFMTSPKPEFTSFVAHAIARDEEFTKTLLEDLKKKKLVVEIKKNPKGLDYLRRSRWTLSEEVYKAYKSKQANF